MEVMAVIGGDDQDGVLPGIMPLGDVEEPLDLAVRGAQRTLRFGRGGPPQVCGAIDVGERDDQQIRIVLRHRAERFVHGAPVGCEALLRIERFTRCGVIAPENVGPHLSTGADVEQRGEFRLAE